MSSQKRFTFETKRDMGLGRKRRSIDMQRTSKEPLVSFKRKKGSSKYLGVLYVKKQRKWRAQICHKGKKQYIGSFETEIEAALARDEMVKKKFGPNTKFLNFANTPTNRVNKRTEEEAFAGSFLNCASLVKTLPSPKSSDWQEPWAFAEQFDFFHPTQTDPYGDFHNFAFDNIYMDPLTYNMQFAESLISPRVGLNKQWIR